MSARQRARLQQKDKKVEIANEPSPSEDDDESDGEADTKPKSKSVFVFDNSDDSSNSSDDDSSTELKLEVPIASNKKPIPAVKPKVVETQVKRGGFADEDEELKYLDEELAKIQSDLKDNDGINSQGGGVRAVVRNLLKVEVKNLDIDSIMRKRFGSDSVRRGNEEGDGERPRIKTSGKGKPMPSKLTNRRLIFGSPKEDWTRPPSYVGGGVGMVAYNPTARTHPSDASITIGAASDGIHGSGDGSVTVGPMYYKFIHSAEFQRLNSQYQVYSTRHPPFSYSQFMSFCTETLSYPCLYPAFVFSLSLLCFVVFVPCVVSYQMIADSGDVNRLAIFLSTHPYHPEGLLQLAMVFARTGR